MTDEFDMDWSAYDAHNAGGDPKAPERNAKEAEHARNKKLLEDIRNGVTFPSYMKDTGSFMYQLTDAYKQQGFDEAMAKVLADAAERRMKFRR